MAGGAMRAGGVMRGGPIATEAFPARARRRASSDGASIPGAGVPGDPHGGVGSRREGQRRVLLAGNICGPARLRRWRGWRTHRGGCAVITCSGMVLRKCRRWRRRERGLRSLRGRRRAPVPIGHQRGAELRDVGEPPVWGSARGSGGSCPRAPPAMSRSRVRIASTDRATIALRTSAGLPSGNGGAAVTRKKSTAPRDQTSARGSTTAASSTRSGGL